MSSSPLPNYLRSHRKRLGLSQEEVAFLLGFRGQSKGAGVCKDERFDREPSLRSALAYELIYQKPAHELFAGLYEQIKADIAARAKILACRKDSGVDSQTSRKRELFASLAVRQPNKSINQEQT